MLPALRAPPPLFFFGALNLGESRSLGAGSTFLGCGHGRVVSSQTGGGAYGAGMTYVATLSQAVAAGVAVMAMSLGVIVGVAAGVNVSLAAVTGMSFAQAGGLIVTMLALFATAAVAGTCASSGRPDVRDYLWGVLRRLVTVVVACVLISVVVVLVMITVRGQVLG